MKPTLSERKIVIVLFIMVLITFSLAQEDTKKMEKGFTGASAAFSSSHLLLTEQKETPKHIIAE